MMNYCEQCGVRPAWVSRLVEALGKIVHLCRKCAGLEK